MRLHAISGTYARGASFQVSGVRVSPAVMRGRRVGGVVASDIIIICCLSSQSTLLATNQPK
jgi:hypothetical protein